MELLREEMSKSKDNGVSLKSTTSSVMDGFESRQLWFSIVELMRFFYNLCNDGTALNVGLRLSRFRVRSSFTDQTHPPQ